MKKILLLLFVFSTMTIAQNKSISINWKGLKTFHTEANSFTVPYFTNENTFDFGLDKGLVYTQEWNSGVLINPNSLIISNIQYQDVSVNDLADLKTLSIPNAVNVKLNNVIDREKIGNMIQFSPIIKVGNSYKKVISLSVSYSGSRSSYASANRSRRAVSNSVLSSGIWYKFAVDQTGAHIIDKAFLSQLGINTVGLNPRSIKIYGNGGHMIPYLNDDSQPLDPLENAIQVVGEEDGVFNDNDFILFYAEGPKGYDQVSDTFLNIYNDETFYYLTVGGNNGKRIQPFIQSSQPSDEILTTFKDTKFHELDEYSLAFVGRRWFGDKFDIERSKQFDFNFQNLVQSEPVNVKVIAASPSGSGSSMAVSVNGVQQATLTFPGVTTFLADEAIYAGDITATSDNITVNLEHDNFGNPLTEAYIDYIRLDAIRNLAFAGTQFQFQPNVANPASAVVTLNFDNAAAVQDIWEVSDLHNVKKIPNPGLNNIAFKSVLSAGHKFQTVSNLNYFRPKTVSNPIVFNQNIKGTIFNNANGDFQDIDYLMLTPATHLLQANRLAQINRNVNGLNVKVVTIESIYNEFNTGNPDISAIRNFVKYVYNNASSPNNRVKYLCLFGDTSFDYKERIFPNTYNFPTWNAYSSFNLTDSFVSDDFFGMMDVGEGNMVDSDRLDIAVGRIVADTPLKAQQMVTKVEQYYAQEALGSWRNNITMISDDVDEEWEKILQNTTDDIANTILAEKPFLNVKKVHSDSFVQESTAGGDRYPEVKTIIADESEKGSLALIYFGHGGEDGIASERVFTTQEVVALRNICKYFLFVTVTCEFTKFDNPLRLTAGEYSYWNPQGGAIGLITTTRQIFVDVGTSFNITLAEYLFSYNPNDNFGPNEYPSVAEAVRLTKNDPRVSSTRQKMLIFSIGDPALKLAVPKSNIKLTKVNDVLIANQTEPLSALGYAKIEGEVTNEQGQLLSDYNGVLTTVLFDKNEQRSTLANDGTREGGSLIKLDFQNLGRTIYRGRASVTNGKFSFEFIVPRDIAIPVGNGRVSFYANKTNTLLDQAGASIDELKIGGINLNAPEDNIGPKITLHLNDKSFASGGLTNREPLLLASFEDENGINTASGIGHDITAIIDGDEVNPVVLNDYYLTEVDNYKKGNLDFKFRDLEPGPHTLTLKAWDVYNNSSTVDIQFLVVDDNTDLVIDKVLNYPNPFINYTEFWFTHNSSEALNVSVQIFTISGKLVRTINGQTTANTLKSPSSTSRDIVWDGKDDFGDKIGKGTYIYKLKVNSPSLNKTVEKIEKLVILQ